MQQPTLDFVELPPQTPTARERNLAREARFARELREGLVWPEVPQPVFLSWSPARQLSYCAARDEHAARFADSPAEAEWFTQRASLYKGDLDAIRQQSPVVQEHAVNGEHLRVP
jgi:hypothetical protein